MAWLRSIAVSQVALCALTVSPSAVGAGPAPQMVKVYAYRQMPFVQPLLDEFTGETGIVVSVESGPPEALLARLKSEGRTTPADVLLTIDVTNLTAAARAGVLQPLRSHYLQKVVPPWLRDKDGYWTAQTLWPRAILSAPGEPVRNWNYSELGSPAEKGRVCVRSSTDIYSASFMGSAVANLGQAGATRWASNIVSNLAAPPFKNGKELVKAVEAGTCRVALDNAFYVGRQRSDADDVTARAARSVGVAWPSGWNTKRRGTTFAVSGGALTTYAPHAAAGRRLLEFLARPGIQARYASSAAEYPALLQISAPPAFAGAPVPRFDRRSLRFDQAGREAATAIYRTAGWN